MASLFSIDSLPAAEPVNLVEKMSLKRRAGGNRRLVETRCLGVFAVGDVRSGSVKHVAASVGEGARRGGSPWFFFGCSGRDLVASWRVCGRFTSIPLSIWCVAFLGQCLQVRGLSADY
jgi:hypothetical protein